MQDGKDIETPTGKLQWRAGSGGFEELRKGSVLIARGKLPGTFRRKHSDLELYVPGDEFLLDLAISSWISMLKTKTGNDATAEVVGEVVGALAGA